MFVCIFCTCIPYCVLDYTELNVENFGQDYPRFEYWFRHWPWLRRRSNPPRYPSPTSAGYCSPATSAPAPPRSAAPPLSPTAVLALTCLGTLAFAEHLGRRLGSTPQHYQGRRQGKVRTPCCYSLDSRACAVLPCHPCICAFCE